MWNMTFFFVKTQKTNMIVDWSVLPNPKNSYAKWRESEARQKLVKHDIFFGIQTQNTNMIVFSNPNKCMGMTWIRSTSKTWPCFRVMSQMWTIHVPRVWMSHVTHTRHDLKLGARSGRDASCNVVVDRAGQYEPIVLVRVLAYHGCMYKRMRVHIHLHVDACMQYMHVWADVCMCVREGTRRRLLLSFAVQWSPVYWYGVAMISRLL